MGEGFKKHKNPRLYMNIIEKNDKNIVFRAIMETALANALRRSVMEVPILAIDEAEIYKNDSALYDEVIAHRLGLVPLKMDKSMTDKTEVELKLVKTGHGFVHSGDLKGKAEVVYENMPITLLEEDKEIEIVAVARIGHGINHAKFSPGIANYNIGENKEITFSIESFGQKTAEKILTEAIEVLKNNLDKVKP